ncbi:MAG TPA: sarcosine oxidase subunit alpha family protein [Steroidobacteraceae bacterium]
MTTSDRSYRLNSGGLIDRTRPLAFQFDAQAYTGFAGDTLASALLACGVRLVGRSFKYHRPRGLLTAGSEEPNALVELRTGARREPNTKATVAELFAGCEAYSQNRWPSLSFDLGAINSLFSPILVAGFYYKTFMWPRKFWEKLYEPAIRRAAGLGRASAEPDPDRYEKAHLFCDVLVIGGGPAGLAAALTAARSGARVVLCDEDFVLGGRLNSERYEIDGDSGSDWARKVEAELASMSDVRILRRTTVFGAYDGEFGAVERVSDHLPIPPAHLPRQRLWKIIAKRSILTAGAIERPIVFGGNDRPGVMMAAAVRTYVNRFGVAPGRKVAIFTTTDDGWKTAADLTKAGVGVEAVIDARRDATAPIKINRAWFGAQVIDTHGSSSLRGITVRDRDGNTTRLNVDTLAVSGGWNPAIGLTTHLGQRPKWSNDIAAFVPGELPRGMSVAGAATGTLALSDALKSGSRAGADAAKDVGKLVIDATAWRTDDEATGVAPLWIVESRSKSFVDFQNDVTSEDVALAAREGYRSVELLKRYTTLGMATDQGRTSNVNGLAIMAALTERGIPEVGTTTFRPPYTPVAIAAMSGAHRGKHSSPTRYTAGHAWAMECGASFVEAGDWLRAQWFAAPSETSWLETVTREVKTVRTNVGVCDVSTLGKIDVQGADAATFLDRVYINTYSTLPVGKIRYGLMLREDGFVMDDGTTARLARDRYIMSTTTANAARVMQHLEHARQILWPQLDVQLASATEQWSQYSIAGPKSRQVLDGLLQGALDVSNEAFPYMACAEFNWNGRTARLFRISFSGELAYELAVPARYGDATIRAIMAAGEPFGITPYGLEALGIMRLEKGHIAGAELNGTTTAADLGLGRMMSAQKDFIGKVLSKRPALMDTQRAVLVGIKPVDRWAQLRGGSHLVTLRTDPTLENDQGYITSANFSPMLEQWIGLGLLIRGRERIGERIRVFDPLRDGDFEAEIVDPVFFDPEGARLRA